MSVIVHWKSVRDLPSAPVATMAAPVATAAAVSGFKSDPNLRADLYCIVLPDVMALLACVLFAVLDMLRFIPASWAGLPTPLKTPQHTFHMPNIFALPFSVVPSSLSLASMLIIFILAIHSRASTVSCRADVRVV